MAERSKKNSTGEGPSHHHEGWLEHLSNLGLVHSGMHLPFAVIFLTLTFLIGVAATSLLFLRLLDHWDDRRVAAREQGQADAAAAAQFMDSQLEEIISVARHAAEFDLTEGRYSIDESVPVDPQDDDPNVPRNPLEERLYFLLENNPGFWGVGACFEEHEGSEQYALLKSLNQDARERAVANGLTPHETGAGTGLYCPYYTRPGGEVTFTPVTYDYADPNYFLPGADQPRGRWYQRPRDDGEGWNPPYFGTTSRRMVAEYGIPFFDDLAARDGYLVSGASGTVVESGQEAFPAGVVFVNFTLDQISRSVSWLNLGGRGYGFVVDSDGTYVAHPDNLYYSDPERQKTGKTQRSLRELGDDDYADYAPGRLDKDALLALDGRRLDCETAQAPGASDALVSEAAVGSGYIDFRDELTGKDSWIFYEPVSSACWTLGSVVIKSEVLGRDAEAHHLLLWISAALMIAVFSFLALVFRVVRGDGWFAWSAVITFSVLCALGVGWVWWLARTTPQVEAGLNGDGQSLVEIVDNYTRRVRQDERLDEVTPVYAGVSLTSVEDASDHDLVLSGVSWQRFTEEDAEAAAVEPRTFEPGFVFSDNPGDTDFELLYDETNGKTRSLGWSFRTRVPGPSDITQFPFDRGTVTLRLAPKDIDKPIILIPDLPEYNLTAPAAKPGLGDEFALAGWSIERSYYEYQPNPRDSTIGIADYSVREDEPQLAYSILFARSSVTPFISRMLPVIVVSILVFCLFVIVYSTRLHPEDFQIGTGVGALSFLSALMFVLILGHNSLRSELGTSGIIYLEYFYFIIYFAVLAVAIRTISMLFGYGVGWTHYRTEFTLARIYWPSVALAALVATWLAFY